MNFSGTSSVLTLNGSEVNGNTAPNAGGGGIQNLLGSVTLNSSKVNGNTSLNGGGISSGNGNGGMPPGHQPPDPEQQRGQRQHGHRPGAPAGSQAVLPSPPAASRTVATPC